MRNSHFRLFLIVMSLLPGACAAGGADEIVIQIGATREEVRARLGEPKRVLEFNLPEAPFFGPQESLLDLIPPGTLVEEWVYAVGDEEFYVWFAGEEGQVKDEWRVIETGRYPIGAVY